MPKHETPNTFYCITWEVNRLPDKQINLARLRNITERKIFLLKNFMKNVVWQLVPGSF